MRKRPLHAEKPQMEINSFEKQNHGVTIYTLLDNAFKDTVVNRTLSSVHGGSIEIMLLTVF